MKRRSSQYPKLSNRQRMRNADAAVALQQKDRMILLAVLAQKGGEVVITAGTVAQLDPRLEMSYVVVDGANESEKIVRLVVVGTETTNNDSLPAPGGGVV